MSLDGMRKFFSYQNLKNPNSHAFLNKKKPVYGSKFDSDGTYDFNIWEKFSDCEQTIKSTQVQGNCHAAWAVSFLKIS